MKLHLTLIGIIVLSGSGCSTRASGAEAPLPAVLSVVDRPTLVSPDGKWDITVWGEKDESPWIMLEARDAQPKYRVQVWPIPRSAIVLWAPDSQAFAFTDARFADHYFLYVDHVRGYLSSEITDLSSLVESHFSSFIDRRYGVDKWYAKPLLWVKKDLLLVGIDCVTSEKLSPQPKYQPVKNWFRAYLLNVQGNKLVSDLGERETKERYGIDLLKEKW